jgi:wyosine [tRNA(Phe)-imidazoG37] synthetase (radical SAM superfamily)
VAGCPAATLLFWGEISYHSAMSKHVFGPVPSRRLGFSLGVDPVPRKYCNFDCIYCQVGKTTDKENERRRFFDPEQIVAEVLEEVSGPKHIDIITFSGSGEPTLNKDLGWMIRELKRSTEIPLAVITNGSLLWLEEVEKDLLPADIVLPSLDAVSEETFRDINRPHLSISIEKIISGLRSFRKAYRGGIWLEIMLIHGMNDSAEELEKFREVLGRISFDKIQLNTVTRPAHDKTAKPVNNAELARIGQILGGHTEVICGFDKRAEGLGIDDWVAAVLAILDRRSLTIDDIVKLTGISLIEAGKRLARLEQQQFLQVIEEGETRFYVKRQAPG